MAHKREEHSAAPLPFRKQAAFVLSAPKADFFVRGDLPEVAVIGRSNVGKSSLINALLGNKDMAKTSKTPGRTREVNFFAVGGMPPVFHLVDLPGYGYAKISKSDHKSWRDLCESYLAQRAQLRRVLLLIDARHEIKDTDLQMLDALSLWRVPVSLVLTKCDQANAKEIALHENGFAALQSHYITLLAPLLKTSSAKRVGINNLQHEILQMVSA